MKNNNKNTIIWNSKYHINPKSPLFFSLPELSNPESCYLKIHFGDTKQNNVPRNLQGILLIPRQRFEVYSNIISIMKKNTSWLQKVEIIPPPPQTEKPSKPVPFATLVKIALAKCSEEDLVLVGDFFSISFILDDILDREWKSLKNIPNCSNFLKNFLLDVILKILTGDDSNINKYADVGFPKYQAFCKGFKDIYNRLSARLGQNDIHDFNEALKKYFDGLISGFEARVNNNTKRSEKDLLNQRQHTLGLHSGIVLCQKLLGINFSKDEQQNPELIKLIEMVVQAYSDFNDIFFIKELIEESPENLVLLKRDQYKKFLPESMEKASEKMDQKILTLAFEYAIKSYNLLMEKIFAQKTKLPDTPAMHNFFELQLKLLRDNVEWHLMLGSSRYKIEKLQSKEFDTLTEATEYNFFPVSSNDNQITKSFVA